MGNWGTEKLKNLFNFAYRLNGKARVCIQVDMTLKPFPLHYAVLMTISLWASWVFIFMCPAQVLVTSSFPIQFLYYMPYISEWHPVALAFANV